MTKKNWGRFAASVLVSSMLFGSVAYATPKSIDTEELFNNSTYFVEGLYHYDDINTVQYGNDYYKPFRRMEMDLDRTDGFEVPLDYETVSLEEAPQSVQDWVQRSLEYELGQVYEADDGYTYVLVTRGEKSSGGYTVTIDQIFHDEWGIWIQTKENDPEPGRFVTAGVTYPYALVKINELPADEFHFINSAGDEIQSLPGILYLPPVEQKTDNIVLFKPIISDDGMVTIHGIVRSHADMAMITKLESGEQKWIEIESGWTYFLKTMERDNVRDLKITTYGEDGNIETVETKKVE